MFFGTEEPDEVVVDGIGRIAVESLIINKRKCKDCERLTKVIKVLEESNKRIFEQQKRVQKRFKDEACLQAFWIDTMRKDLSNDFKNINDGFVSELI